MLDICMQDLSACDCFVVYVQWKSVDWCMRYMFWWDWWWRIHLLPCKICRRHIHRKQTQTLASSFPKEPSIEYFHFFLLCSTTKSVYIGCRFGKEEKGHQNSEIASHQITLHCRRLSSLTFFLCILIGNKSWPTLWETYWPVFVMMYLPVVHEHLYSQFSSVEKLSFVAVLKFPIWRI